jgi:hypothetical protein
MIMTALGLASSSSVHSETCSSEGPLVFMPDFSDFLALGDIGLVPSRERSYSVFEAEKKEEGAAKIAGVYKSCIHLKIQLKSFQTILYENLSAKSFSFIAEVLSPFDYVQDIKWPMIQDAWLLDLVVHLAIIPYDELERLDIKLTSCLHVMPLKNFREMALKAKALKHILDKGDACVDLVLGAPQLAYSMAIEVSFKEGSYEIFSALLADIKEEKALSILQTLFEGLLAKKEDTSKFFKLIAHFCENLGRHYHFPETQKAVSCWLEMAQSF